MARVYIGIGSNLGDRRANIVRAKEALARIDGVAIVRESSMEETRPVDFLEQPDFMNQVVLVETDIAPRGLLKILQRIEDSMGRERTVPKGPRIIDLDMLLYGSESIDSDDLKVPHPEILRRPFVLRQLLEVEPGLADPVSRTPYREVYDAADKEHQ
jgi:2-amino-4-hydroxy-6-hydroxymethyldihydropteridine diphosphokinase